MLLVKAILTLDGKYNLLDVVEAQCDVETRTNWDPTLRVSKIVKKYNKNLLTYYYEIYIPVPFMNNREFVEKRLVFRWKDMVYIYNSSIDDSLYPHSGDLTRGTTVFSGSRIRRKGPNIVIETATQMDFKVSLPTFFIGGKIADGTLEFLKQLVIKLDAKR